VGVGENNSDIMMMMVSTFEFEVLRSDLKGFHPGRLFGSFVDCHEMEEPPQA